MHMSVYMSVHMSICVLRHSANGRRFILLKNAVRQVGLEPLVAEKQVRSQFEVAICMEADPASMSIGLRAVLGPLQDLR